MSTSGGIPQVIAELAQIAGWDAAWTLVRAKGGTEIFLPKSIGRHHWLSELVGYEAALAICTYYRADHTFRLLIPMATNWQRGERLREALKSDLSVEEMALDAGVHKRTIYRHRAKPKGLFD